MKNLTKLVSFILRAAEDRPYSRLTVVALVLAGVIAGLAGTGLLAVINATLSHGADTTRLWLFVGLTALLPLGRVTSQVLLVRLSQGMTYDLRLRLSRRILDAPLRQLETLGASRLMATLVDDIGTVTRALSHLPVFFLQLAVVVSCLVYMGWLSRPLLLAVLAVVAIGVASYQLPVFFALRHFRQARESWDDLVSHFRGLTEGTKELKIHDRRRRAFLDCQIEPTAGELRHHNVMGGILYALANSWGQVLFFILIGSVLFVAPGITPLTDRVTTGYTLAILYMLTPLDVILSQLPALSRAAVAADKVERLGLSLHDGREPADRAHDRRLPPAQRDWRRLELEAVSHTYYREDEDDHFTLGPIDLTIEPGELVFLVGGNGSGKTTLAKLLIGLYPPESGTVRLDGEPVDERSRDLYRQLFSVVFSDFHLFEALLGIEGPGLDEDARAYLERLHLVHKVRVEDGRLSTIDLSQGQRKRLALLTAYLEDRSIYVFDEWAADQDPLFKDIFYLEILPELVRRGKTAVVISHDDHYYGVGERIVKLDYGRVVFDGDIEDYRATWKPVRRLPVSGGRA